MREEQGEECAHNREGERPRELRPQRKRPIHGVHTTRDGPTIVFITACTRKREPWLANRRCHEILRKVWRAADGWLIGRYVIMPDHIHFVAAPGTMDVELEIWMRYWKRLVTQARKGMEGRWQESHWDTRMRTQRNYQEKWEYVCENPVRHGLVTDADDWPFKGEIHELGW